tara:strand:- start:3975 stop:4154 length:180 start_codon:yes stop_codon:yes gene_type:complete
MKKTQITSTGGDARGDRSTYTVRQTVYTAALGSGASLSQGVQQAYEIEMISNCVSFQVR